MDRLNGTSGLGSINFITGPLAGKNIQLHKATLTIGREPGKDIVVSDLSISRRHAQITLNGGIWTISNLTQQNTVTVNQRDVPPFQQSPISQRDTIRLGTETTFLFLPNAAVSIFPQPAQNTQSPPQAPPVAPRQQTFQNVLPYNPTMAPPPPPPPVGQVQRQSLNLLKIPNHRRKLHLLHLDNRHFRTSYRIIQPWHHLHLLHQLDRCRDSPSTCSKYPITAASSTCCTSTTDISERPTV